MRIFQLKNLPDGFASIDFEGVDMTSVLKEGKVELLNGRSFIWDKSHGEAISDCPFYMGALPIFESKKLGKVLELGDVKVANIMVENVPYTVIGAYQFGGNVINRELSSMRTFRSGKIMQVSEYVFNAGITYPDIFTLKEFMLYTFCDLETAKRLMNCDFSQLIFKECPIR